MSRLRSTLVDAVREQMVSEVPLGAFLSGGIDSTIIVGLMQQASNRPVKTFAIGFPDRDYDETTMRNWLHATWVQSTRHSSSSPKRGKRFQNWPGILTSRLLIAQRFPTWHVSRETRHAVTVALTGDAGDELFGGYDRYRALALTELFHRLPTGVLAGYSVAR